MGLKIKCEQNQGRAKEVKRHATQYKNQKM